MRRASKSPSSTIPVLHLLDAAHQQILSWGPYLFFFVIFLATCMRRSSGSAWRRCDPPSFLFFLKSTASPVDGLSPPRCLYPLSLLEHESPNWYNLCSSICCGYWNIPPLLLCGACADALTHVMIDIIFNRKTLGMQTGSHHLVFGRHQKTHPNSCKQRWAWGIFFC